MAMSALKFLDLDVGVRSASDFLMDIPEPKQRPLSASEFLDLKEEPLSASAFLDEEREKPIMGAGGGFGKEGVLYPVERGLKAMGHGLAKGTQAFWGFFDDAATLVSRATGLDKGGAFEALVEMGEPPADWQPKDLAEKIVSGLAAAGPEIGLISAIPGSAAVSMGTIGAVRGGAKGGAKEAAKEAVKGALLGGILKGAGQIPKPYHAPTVSGVFGGLTAAEGGTAEEIAESAGVGMGLGVLGGGRKRGGAPKLVEKAKVEPSERFDMTSAPEKFDAARIRKLLDETHEADRIKSNITKLRKTKAELKKSGEKVGEVNKNIRSLKAQLYEATGGAEGQLPTVKKAKVTKPKAPIETPTETFIGKEIFKEGERGKPEDIMTLPGPAKEIYSYEGKGFKTYQMKKSTAGKGEADNSKWKVETSEEISRLLKDDIHQLKAGKFIKRKKTVDLDGTERWTGSSSDFPEWFRNQGWGSKEAATALEAFREGKPLGIKQTGMVEAAIKQIKKSTRKDAESLAKLIEEKPKIYLEGYTDKEYNNLIRRLKDEDIETSLIEEIHRKQTGADRRKSYQDIEGALKKQGYKPKEIVEAIDRAAEQISKEDLDWYNEVKKLPAKDLKQSTFVKPKEKGFLKPTEYTPYEKAAELEKQGVLKRPERVSQKAVFPEGYLKTIPGEQTGLFGVQKGEQHNLLDTIQAKADKGKLVKKEKPIEDLKVGRADYEERLEAKKELYADRASKARETSKSSFEAAHKESEQIPFGQPILVGHHSEKGHRAHLKRIDNKMRKAVVEDKKADYYADKAESIGKGGISSDDPQVLVKLKAKIEKAEKNQETMKGINKIVKSKKLTESEKIDKIQTEYGYKDSTVRKLLEKDFAGRVGFPDYSLTNNNANIRRMKQRFEVIKKKAGDKTTEFEGTQAKVIDNVEANRVQIIFDGKPEEAMRNKLKAGGFKWARSEGAWQRQRSTQAMFLAKKIADVKEGFLKPTRHFQKYTSEQRAERAGSQRLTGKQREAKGEYFYTNEFENIAYPTAKEAKKAALDLIKSEKGGVSIETPRKTQRKIIKSEPKIPLKSGRGKVVKQRKLPKTKILAPAIYENEVITLVNAKRLPMTKMGRVFETPIRTYSEIKKITIEPYNAAEDTIARENIKITAGIKKLKKGVSYQNRKNIMLYAVNKQKGGAERLANQGVKEKDIPKTLTPKEDVVYEGLRNRYEEFYLRLNEARITSGKKPFPKRTDYFTFMHDLKLLDKMGLHVIEADVNIVNDAFLKLKTTPFKYAKMRAWFNPNKLVLDPFYVFESYKQSALKHIHLSPLVARLREYQLKLEHPVTGEEWRLVNENPVLAKSLHEWTNHIAGQKISKIPPVFEKMIYKVNSNLLASILGANARSAMIQPTALRNSVAEIGPTYMSRGIKSLFIPSERSEAIAKSKVILSAQYDTTVHDALSAIRGGKIGEIKKKGAKWSLKPLQLLDMEARKATWQGGYKYASEKLKMSEPDAVLYADDLVIRTQASGLPGHIAPIQRGPVGKLFTLFQTFTINDWDFLIKDVLGKGSGGIKNKKAFKKVMTYVAATTLFNILYEDVFKITSPFPTPIRVFREALEEGKGIVSTGLDVLKELIEPIPIIGSARYGQGIGGPAAQLVSETTKHLTQQPFKKPLLEIAGKWTGVPGTAQIGKSVRAKKRGESTYGQIVGSYTPKNKRGKLVRRGGSR